MTEPWETGIPIQGDKCRQKAARGARTPEDVCSRGDPAGAATCHATRGLAGLCCGRFATLHSASCQGVMNMIAFDAACIAQACHRDAGCPQEAAPHWVAGIRHVPMAGALTDLQTRWAAACSALRRFRSGRTPGRGRSCLCAAAAPAERPRTSCSSCAPRTPAGWTPCRRRTTCACSREPHNRVMNEGIHAESCAHHAGCPAASACRNSGGPPRCYCSPPTLAANKPNYQARAF